VTSVREVSFNGRVVGELLDGRTFVTERDSTRHFFRKFGGYGVSESLLKRLRFEGVEVIEFVVDGIQRYRTSIERMLSEGAVWFDGGDQQRVMSVGELVELSDLWVEQPRRKPRPEPLEPGDEGSLGSGGGGSAASIQSNLAQASAAELYTAKEVARRLGYHVGESLQGVLELG
jgi:hypothetical protein